MIWSQPAVLGGRGSILGVNQIPVSIRAHRRQNFAGRDPDEEHRTATPLELLYDLTFVVAFGTAANELARYLADAPLRDSDSRVRDLLVRGRLGVDQLLVGRLCL